MLKKAKKTADSKSQTKPNPEPHWAKLVSMNPTHDNFDLSKKLIKIGKKRDNDLVIKTANIKNCHCKIFMEDNDKVFIEDNSSDGIFINNKKLGKGKKQEIDNGDKVILVHSSQTDKPTEEIGYLFCLNITQTNKLKRERDETSSQSDKKSELSLKQIKSDEDHEEFKCSICMNLMYKPSTVVPCLHDFCASCISKSLKYNKKCPYCREPIWEIRKNVKLNGMIEKIYEKNPEKKPTLEEQKAMDNESRFKNESKIKVRRLEQIVIDDSPTHGTSPQTININLGLNRIHQFLDTLFRAPQPQPYMGIQSSFPSFSGFGRSNTNQQNSNGGAGMSRNRGAGGGMFNPFFPGDFASAFGMGAPFNFPSRMTGTHMNAGGGSTDPRNSSNSNESRPTSNQAQFGFDQNRNTSNQNRNNNNNNSGSRAQNRSSNTVTQRRSNSNSNQQSSGPNLREDPPIVILESPESRANIDLLQQHSTSNFPFGFDPTISLLGDFPIPDNASQDDLMHFLTQLRESPEAHSSMGYGDE